MGLEDEFRAWRYGGFKDGAQAVHGGKRWHHAPFAIPEDRHNFGVVGEAHGAAEGLAEEASFDLVGRGKDGDEEAIGPAEEDALGDLPTGQAEILGPLCGGESRRMWQVFVGHALA